MYHGEVEADRFVVSNCAAVTIACRGRLCYHGSTNARHTGIRKGFVNMEADNESSYLKQVTIFSSLSDSEMRDLMSVAKRRRFRAGEVIFHRDDPGQVLYIIKEGKVKICLISPDGQEISLVVFGKGEYFGEFSLLDGLPRSTDASPWSRSSAIPYSAATSTM